MSEPTRPSEPLTREGLQAAVRGATVALHYADIINSVAHLHRETVRTLLAAAERLLQPEATPDEMIEQMRAANVGEWACDLNHWPSMALTYRAAERRFLLKGGAR